MSAHQTAAADQDVLSVGRGPWHVVDWYKYSKLFAASILSFIAVAIAAALSTASPQRMAYQSRGSSPSWGYWDVELPVQQKSPSQDSNRSSDQIGDSDPPELPELAQAQSKRARRKERDTAIGKPKKGPNQSQRRARLQGSQTMDAANTCQPAEWPAHTYHQSGAWQ